jgi:SAM-dependent methyltransferase
MYKKGSILFSFLLILGGAFHAQVTPTASLSIVTSSPLPQGWQKSPYSQTLGATGGAPPYVWSVTSGALPRGLTFASGGAISGTPTSIAGLYSFTVQVKDSAGATATARFALTIGPFPNYEELYRDPRQPYFTTEPNAFLISSIKDLKPGEALDVGMGQGRNAVYLATKGWDVTGFDISDEGLKAAAQNAAKAGVRLTTSHARFEDYDYGKERWDLIYFIYAGKLLDPLYVARIRAALKPGGLVLIETRGPTLDKSTPQRGETELDKANALTKAWSDMQIVFYEDTIGIADWYFSGPRLESKTRILRLLARKL